MKRPLRTLGVLATLLFGVALVRAQDPAPEPAQDPPVFRSTAELVVLHVNVFDKRSDAVPNLPQTAFRVIEDDRPQDIAFFRSEDVPVAVGLVIDNSGSMITRRPMVVAGTRAFADSSHPEDELFTIVFNENVRKGLPDGVRFTRSGEQAVASLARFPAGGKTALYDAVIEALEHLEMAAHQKRILLVLSDGGDNASRHTRQEMFDKVLASDAIIYTLVHRADSAGGDDPGLMRRLAEMSGGLAYTPRTERDVIEKFSDVADSIRRGYSIGYVPPRIENEQFRRVKVMVLVPGRNDLSARVRRGYTLSGSSSETADPPVPR